MHRPYTIITAYHEELPTWDLGPADKALLMAFVFCLKLRMDGTSFEKMFPNNSTDYRAD